MPHRLARLLISVLLLCLLAGTGRLHAQEAASDLTGPASVQNQRATDDEERADVLDIDSPRAWDAWKARLRESAGLDFGLDYNVLGFTATKSQGDYSTAGGVFRFFGEWELVNKGSPNSGSLVWKVENRHAYTEIAPQAFGSPLGYLGNPTLVFSDQGTRVTHLFWQQSFAGGRGVSYVGFLDVTDYTDVYPLGNPWTGLSNLAFENGSGTIGGLPDGALGAMVGGFVSDHVYLVGSIVDANGDSSNIFDGFNTLFDQGDTFKTFEIGWTTRQQELFLNNAHLTFWQIDAREDAGTPDGGGVSFSLSGKVGEHFLPFLRGGWARDGGALYDKALSAGFGYSRNPGRSLLGFGLNWSSPNPSPFGPGMRNQMTAELFQLLHLTENIEVTPSLQYIRNPAFATEYDATLLFGLRLRAAF